MNDIQREERSLAASEERFARLYVADRRRALAEPAPLWHPAEMLCDDCGGRGLEVGSINGPYDEPQACLSCSGSGKEPDPLDNLTLRERLVASIAVAMYRKGEVA